MALTVLSRRRVVTAVRYRLRSWRCRPGCSDRWRRWRSDRSARGVLDSTRPMSPSWSSARIEASPRPCRTRSCPSRSSRSRRRIDRTRSGRTCRRRPTSTSTRCSPSWRQPGSAIRSMSRTKATSPRCTSWSKANSRRRVTPIRRVNETIGCWRRGMRSSRSRRTSWSTTSASSPGTRRAPVATPWRSSWRSTPRRRSS